MKEAKHPYKPFFYFALLILVSIASTLFIYTRIPFNISADAFSSVQTLDYFPAKEISFADFIVEFIRFILFG